MKKLLWIVFAMQASLTLAEKRREAPDFDPKRPAWSEALCRKGEALGQSGDAARAKVVEGNTALGLDLYARVRKERGNIFFSPLSISSALAMTYEGAKGATATEIASTLHLPTDANELENGYLSLLANLSCRPYSNSELALANALWKQKGLSVLPDFQKRIEESFHGHFTELDFNREGEKARELINDWTSHETHGKIAELIPPGVLNASTRLVLTNAIYFKSPWETQFEPAKTGPAVFFVNGRKGQKVAMMHVIAGVHSAEYLKEQDFSLLRLSFSQHEASIWVFLPSENSGLARFESKLSVKKLEEWGTRLQPTKIDLSLPKFTITQSLSLKEQLTALGIKRLFKVGEADLGGIDGGKDKLFISAALHKAYVDINEKGAEAAGATAAFAAAGGMPPPETKPVEMRVDHPFFFLLQDKPTKAILFLGRVEDPRVKE